MVNSIGINRMITLSNLNLKELKKEKIEELKKEREETSKRYDEMMNEAFDAARKEMPSVARVCIAEAKALREKCAQLDAEIINESENLNSITPLHLDFSINGSCKKTGKRQAVCQNDVNLSVFINNCSNEPLEKLLIKGKVSGDHREIQLENTVLVDKLGPNEIKEIPLIHKEVKIEKSWGWGDWFAPTDYTAHADVWVYKGMPSDENLTCRNSSVVKYKAHCRTSGFDRNHY